MALSHLLNMLEVPDFNDPEARHVQLSGTVRVDLNVQFLSVLAQQVSEEQVTTLIMSQQHWLGAVK